MSREITYDCACERLAEHFLSDEPSSPQHLARVVALSCAIQLAVETWLEDHAEPEQRQETT